MKNLADSLSATFGVPFTAAPVSPGPWRIERNAKMQFCVARRTEDGKEFVLSASGKASSFKTFAGAQRAIRGAIAKATGGAT